MKKISLVLAMLLTLSLALTGCGASKSDAAMNGAAMDKGYFTNSGSSASMSSPVASVAPSIDAVMPEKEYVSDSKAEVGSAIYENQSNKIIRTANLTIQTTEFDNAVAALNDLTARYNGYYETAEVSSGSIYDNYSHRSAYYVVRIPKEHFTSFRDGTDGIGHVYSLNESNQDVGEAYYDTEARLETLTVKRDRLLELMKKATEMKDIITLEDSLAEVQYQIDQHTSSLRKYDSLIGYSTFYIRLNEVQKIVEKPAVTQSFGEKLLASLTDGFENFVRGLEYFAYWFAENLIGLTIFAILIVIVCIPSIRRIRKRRAARKIKKAAPETPKADSEE